MTRRFNLDDLVPEEAVVVIGGKEYSVTRPVLAQIPKLQEITLTYKLDEIEFGQAMTDEQQKGLRKMVFELIKGITDEVIDSLTSAQWIALQRIITDAMNPAFDLLQEFFGDDDISRAREALENVVVAKATGENAEEEGEEGKEDIPEAKAP